MGVRSKRLCLEEVWVASVAGVIAAFFVVLASSWLVGGLGIVRTSDGFLLRQGALAVPIRNDLGWAYFAATQGLAGAGIVAGCLTVAVYVRHGTIRVAAVAREARVDRRLLERWLQWALLFAALPLFALLVRALY
jgi:hypothetical protein